MAQLLNVHPTHPQPRLVRHGGRNRCAGGGVIAYPTDSSYALGCRIGDADAAQAHPRSCAASMRGIT